MPPPAPGEEGGPAMKRLLGLPDCFFVQIAFFVLVGGAPLPVREGAWGTGEGSGVRARAEGIRSAVSLPPPLLPASLRAVNLLPPPLQTPARARCTCRRRRTGRAFRRRRRGGAAGLWASGVPKTAALRLVLKLLNAIRRMTRRRMMPMIRVMEGQVGWRATASASFATSGLPGCICWSSARICLASAVFLRSKASTTTSL